MITLREQEPFAIGGKRECYVHPEDPGICIKIHRKDALPAFLRKQAPWWRAIRKNENKFDENYSDFKVLDKISSAHDPSFWQHLPRLHGWVETDRGKGLAIELLRDHDGLISRTLLDCIWDGGYSDKIDSAVAAFASFWESHNIPSRSLGLSSIIAQDKGDAIRLVLIDGFGYTHLIPIANWFNQYATRRNHSKIERLRREIDEVIARRVDGREPNQLGLLLRRN